MSKQIHFLGWDKPVTDTAARFILNDFSPPDNQAKGTVTGAIPPLARMDGVLIVVPTKEAGRRLRERMTVLCHENNAALLGARIVTPLFLLQTREKAEKMAGDTMVKSAWIKTLINLRHDDCRGLFPRGIPSDNINWALDTARIIQQLRDDLSDACLSIQSVIEKHSGDLQEIERWQDLNRIEDSYLLNLGKTGFLDPCAEKLAAAKSPGLPAGIEKIILASVPDPSLLALTALGELSRKLKIEILVMAPEDLKNHFDDWGRPLPDKWPQRLIDIPNPEKNIRIAGNPAAQARLAGELIRAGEYQLPDICIGVPDREVIPYLQNCLEAAGTTSFDPADRPVKDHHLYHLVKSWHKLTVDPSFASSAAFLHQADVLECLREEHGINAGELLAEMDLLQNTALPQTMRDAQAALKKTAKFENLKKAFEFTNEVMAAANEKPHEEALREFLQRTFAAKTLAGNSDDDDDFKAVAALISDILNDITYARPYLKEQLGQVVPQLIIGALDGLSIPRHREGALIDLNGWMELAWNDAPLMIITGFNEGFVPDSRKSDIFLPDSLKKNLGLRNNTTHFATDAYLLSLILAARAKDGRVILVAGKTSSAGDPLKPSRLLFRCPDEQLPERAAFVFGELKEETHNPPFSISFKLDPAAPLARLLHDSSEISGSAGIKPAFMPTELRVTQFRDYLACPFRFFLKHVLKMDRKEFKAELDALDFGTAIHVILERFAGNPGINRSTDPDAIQKHLENLLDDHFKHVYGANDSFPILYAREIAGQRLKAFARRQAEAAAAGWEIAAREMSCRITMAGIAVSGKIDRIDVNRHDGKMRIIDYKTSDSAQNPEKAHLKKSRKAIPDFARHAENEQWIDLQIPLYWQLCKGNELFKKNKGIELCYFNLPRAVSNAGIETWEDFNESVADSALKSAEAIIERIKLGVFWPPADSISYDDFESLHNNDIREYFDGDKLATFMKESPNPKHEIRNSDF